MMLTTLLHSVGENVSNALTAHSSMLTTYGLALMGFFSTEAILSTLGALLLVVRLSYETLRLFRAFRNPESVP